MLSSILRDTPTSVTEVNPDLPRELSKIIRRCLAKDPTRRYQTALDLRNELEELKQDVQSGEVAETPTVGRRRWPAVLAISAMLAGVAALVLFWRAPPPTGPLQLERVTYHSGLSWNPTLSPDGMLVAYSSDRGGDGNLDIWVQHINQRRPMRLTEHPADDWEPSFSPDGSRISFRSERDGGGIYVTNTLGGEERKIVDHGLHPRFSPDGSLIAYFQDQAVPGGLRKMYLIPSEGGQPRPFQSDFEAFGGRGGPLWSPDGKHLLFMGAPIREPTNFDWWVAPVEGGDVVPTGATRTLPETDFVQFPVAWLRGEVLFFAGTTFEGVNLYRAHISPDDWQISGPPEQLTSGPGMSYAASVAAGGRVALARFHWVIHLWRVDLDPVSGSARGQARRISDDTAPKFRFSIARDGSRLAYSAVAGPGEQRRTEIRIRDLASGRETVPISSTSGLVSLDPQLSPDGSFMSWGDNVAGGQAYFVAATGETLGREVCRGCSILSFFSTGTHVLVRSGPTRLVKQDLGDDSQHLLVELDAGAILDADVSWDDQWLALATGGPEGTASIHVLPLGKSPTPVREWILVAESARWVGSPRWSPDGRLLYYQSDRDDFTCIWAQPLDATTKRPSGEPFAVVHAHRSIMKTLLARNSFSLAVSHGMLIFNAAEMTGDIFVTELEPG